MGSFISFAQILEKKIRREIEKESYSHQSQQQSQQHSQEPQIQSELWTHLVGQMDPYRFGNNPRSAVYHRNRPAPRPRPDHKMNAEQEVAFQFFLNNKAGLAANFSRTDLRKAFRNLALKLHPDQGGTSSEFQGLLAARSSLESLFNS